MSFRPYIFAVMLMGALNASAQVASHAPTPLAAHAPQTRKSLTNIAPVGQVGAMANKAVARVNGAVLNEVDLRREMYAIFPYAQQHNGFPKDLEPEIRKGALDMIIFEELLYQDAKRRNVTVPAAQLQRAEAAFRRQFPDNATYEAYVKAEMKGDKAAMREKIRRSLVIERVLKTDIVAKAAVTPAEAKAYYLKNSKQFQHGETFRIQTISIIPPNNGQAVLKEARKRADDAARLAKATKSYQDFGVLAEKMSDDDWHVNMGDRKVIEASKLPPEIVKAGRAMKPGQVSDLIKLGDCYTVFRLVAHNPAGMTPFVEAKTKLQSDLRKQKTQAIRATLGEKLRKNAKIELL